jgi:hypothetical protein
VTPWYATGFREQLLEHSLRPGASQVTPVRIAQSYLLLLFYNLGTLPAGLRWALASAGAGLLALAVLGAGRILLWGSPGARAAVSTVAATALLLEPWAGLVATVFPRAGFSWTYLSGAVPALAVLIGAGLASLAHRPRTWITAALLAALAVGATIESLGAGTEDLHGAVEHVLEVRRPGDAVLPVEWQPGFFPHGQAWRYYGAPRAPDLPVLEHDADYGLRAFPADPPPQRVHVQLRGLPHDAPLMVELRERYAREEAVPFGFGVFVVTFSEPR